MTAALKVQHINLVDGHVHIYDCFDLSQFLEAAYSNFRQRARLCGIDTHFTGILLLSERATESKFQALARCAENTQSINSAGGKLWHVRHTGESCSLLVSNELDEQLLVVAGRQLVTREKLEVLALITGQSLPDGLPITELIEDIKRSGAIAVIPWGVGKWMGGRGRIVGSLLTAENRGKLFLGDNGGRPGFWPSPGYFARARHLGIRVIPGSDPLPLKSEGRRCGRFGFAVQGVLSQEYPGRDLGRLLGDDSVVIQPYGELESTGRFIRNQLLLRLA